MNQFQKIVADLEADWPGWQAWFVPRAVGGTIWCARRWDGSGPVLNEGTSEALADAIERAEKERS
jgi:hypothetical protein